MTMLQREYVIYCVIAAIAAVSYYLFKPEPVVVPVQDARIEQANRWIDAGNKRHGKD